MQNKKKGAEKKVKSPVKSGPAFEKGGVMNTPKKNVAKKVAKAVKQAVMRTPKKKSSPAF